MPLSLMRPWDEVMTNLIFNPVRPKQNGAPVINPIPLISRDSYVALRFQLFRNIRVTRLTAAENNRRTIHVTIMGW